MKVVYDKNNNFALSSYGLKCYNEKRSLNSLCSINDYFLISRHDPILVEVIEMIGSRAGGSGSNLVVVDINSDQYSIIVENGTEIVVCDPVETVNSLIVDIKDIYHSEDTVAKITSKCKEKLNRIMGIINSYSSPLSNL